MMANNSIILISLILSNHKFERIKKYIISFNHKNVQKEKYMQNSMSNLVKPRDNWKLNFFFERYVSYWRFNSTDRCSFKFLFLHIFSAGIFLFQNLKMNLKVHLTINPHLKGEMAISILNVNTTIQFKLHLYSIFKGYYKILWKLTTNIFSAIKQCILKFFPLTT